MHKMVIGPIKFYHYFSFLLVCCLNEQLTINFCIIHINNNMYLCTNEIEKASTTTKQKKTDLILVLSFLFLVSFKFRTAKKEIQYAHGHILFYLFKYKNKNETESEEEEEVMILIPLAIIQPSLKLLLFIVFITFFL